MDDNRITVSITDANDMARSVLHMIVQGEQFNVVASAAGAAARHCLPRYPDAGRRRPRPARRIFAAPARGAKGFIVKPFTSGVLDTFETVQRHCVAVWGLSCPQLGGPAGAGGDSRPGVPTLPAG